MSVSHLSHFIDGDHLRGDTRTGSHLRHEALLEPLGIERGEGFTQPIMGRRLVGKRTEPTQHIELPFAEPGDIGEGLGPSQHRQSDRDSTSSGG